MHRSTQITAPGIPAIGLPPATTDSRIAAILVTGFLGSGKTTLINAVLKSAAFARTLVIVNEFGEAGLDHLLIEGSQDQVILMDSGCLCCQMTGSLRDTLIDVFMRRNAGAISHFDRVIIETSGLANPLPLLATLLADSAVTRHYRFELALTLVDAANGAHALATYEEAVRQVAVADRIVVSKTDTASAADVTALRQAIAAINAHAQVLEHHQGLPPESLFAPETPGQRALTGFDLQSNTSATLRHGPLFGNIRGYAFRFDGMTDWPAYAAWVAQMTRTYKRQLLRCKGILAIGSPDSFWIIQAVRGHFVAPVRYTPASASVNGSGIEGQFLQCICDQVSRDELAESFALLGPGAAQMQDPDTRR